MLGKCWLNGYKIELVFLQQIAIKYTTEMVRVALGYSQWQLEWYIMHEDLQRVRKENILNLDACVHTVSQTTEVKGLTQSF